MQEQIEQLVRNRDSGRIDEDLASLVLAEALANANPKRTANHGVYWYPETWVQGFASISSPQQMLDAVAEVNAGLAQGSEIQVGRVFITRRDVFEQTDSLRLFVAAMAWGYGTTGYGWKRAAKVLEAVGPSGVDRAVTALRTAAQRGYDEAFRSWSRKGTAKLPGLGTAFASKLGYFSTYRPDEGSGLLIADQYIAWSVWALAGPWDVRRTASSYANYVEWAEYKAQEHEYKSEDVERALFRIGRLVRNAWRRQHPA